MCKALVWLATVAGVVAIFALGAGVSFGQMAAQKNIIETLQASGDFKTLASALKAANLDTKLSGKGPFTLFAPTDDAFAKLPQDDLKALMKPENKDKLTRILTYHVVPDRMAAKDLESAKTVKSMEGGELSFRSSEGMLMVNDARVKTPGMQASNGIIYPIDTVMMPRAQQ